MPAPLVLALDAMSGDFGHVPMVAAALAALREFPQLEVVLVGDPALLAASTRAHGSARVQIQAATQTVAMSDTPGAALRHKRDSSMRVAIDLVSQGRASAAVSAGNTGALMSIARHVLKTLPGIDRPAFVSMLPSIHGRVDVLDLGANAECTPEQLCEFAIMGSALATAVRGIERPRIALMNIGEEATKGNPTIRRAAELIEQLGLNYVGYVEGDGPFLAPVDVVVCDGFVGNIALKAGEGVAKLMLHVLRDECRRGPLSRLSALAARPIFRALARRMDPRIYNGASLIGLRHPVIKAHGASDAIALGWAIRMAVEELERQVPARIAALLQGRAPRSHRARPPERMPI